MALQLPLQLHIQDLGRENLKLIGTVRLLLMGAEIVKDTDELGYSNYYYSPGYETTKKYDYRKYNIKTDSRKLKGVILEIKNGYEVRE